jgi:DNA polymerase
MKAQESSVTISKILPWLEWLREMGVDSLKKNKVNRQGGVFPTTEAVIAPSQPLPQPMQPASSLTLPMVREGLGECTRCKLSETRKNIVFGSGSPTAKLMFVGEGPGADEDEQGLPFVGRAGQLLTKMILAMGLSREEVYIANIVKCRPPNNRPPETGEIASCQPFLIQQIEAIRPHIICALGTFAAQTLLSTKIRISDLRGHFHDFQNNAVHGIRVLPTFHPAYLLRNPPEKKRAWEDLQKIMRALKGDE